MLTTVLQRQLRSTSSLSAISTTTRLALSQKPFQLRNMASDGSSSSSDRLVLASRSPSNHVAILTLHRPKAKNALSTPLFDELNAELEKADKDDSVRAIVITGGEKVFAAGADIKEMKDKHCELANLT